METQMQRVSRLNREMRELTTTDHQIKMIEKRLPRGPMQIAKCSCGRETQMRGQYFLAQQDAIGHLQEAAQEAAEFAALNSSEEYNS